MALVGHGLRVVGWLALLVALLLTGPLLAPLMFVLLINAAVTRELDKAEKPLAVPVIGAEHAPNLVDALRRSGVEIEDAPVDPERAVREGDVDLVLRIAPSYDDAWRRGEPAQVELVHDDSQRDAKGSAASECVRFNPPRPASRNLRPTEGMASNRWTCAPAADRVSAAIRPAGPPPMTAMSARREFIGALLLALLQSVQQGSGYGRHSLGRHANTWFLSQ